MDILKSKNNSPFGKYYIKDWFLRIEFQNRGAAHSHILIWTNLDPKEKISEDMQLINSLCNTELIKSEII